MPFLIFQSLIRVCILWLIISLTFVNHAKAQTYFKNPAISKQQRIARFSNGDILIGDSTFEGIQGVPSAIFLTRIGACGTVVWSKSYEQKGLQLTFKDVVINDDDRIFIAGITLVGPREAIFLLQISESGAEQRFRTFESPGAGTTTFSIDWQAGKLLLSGRILFINAPTTGFITLFDDKLNFLWSKKITPFTREGMSIIAQNGDLVLRSEALLFNFDPNGALQWAIQFNRDLDPVPIAGPYEVKGGYIIQASHEETSFFYKISPSGQFLWKSPIFSSTQFPAAVQELTDGQLLVHHAIPETQGNSLGQIRLSEGGNILQQQKLKVAYSLNVGSIFHAIGAHGFVNVIGNKDGIQTGPTDLDNFFIQYNLEEANSDCLEWEAIESIATNKYPLSFASINPELDPLDWNKLPTGGLEVTDLEDPYVETCGVGKEPTLITIDTLLSCKENWSVQLPSDEFEWVDNYEKPQRELESTGSYLAKNRDCDDPIIYDFQLNKIPCDCEVFVPNAFSPNGDGRNDVLELLTDCEITNMEAFVYDRWGNQIANSNDGKEIWNGATNQKEAAVGVYLIFIKYELLTTVGGQQEGTIAQDVYLFR